MNTTAPLLPLLTRSELNAWKHTGWENSIKDKLPAEINGVRLSLTVIGTLRFHYKSGNGLIFTSNSFNGEGMPGGKTYAPRLEVSPSYSSDARYATRCEPTLEAAAGAVIQSWNLFCGHAG
jgi:hypothetical protein